MTDSNVQRRVLLALVVLGIVLRVWQWVAPEQTLWLDEIVLSRNILARSIPELVTQPLAFDQVAPLGFLAAVKLATLAFGDGERALRLFSFLCGVISLLLFTRLATRALRGLAVPLAVALFAIGLAPIRYSGEVKQYGIEAGVAVLLTLVALDLRTRDRSTLQLIGAGAIGLLVIWFSQASAIVMAALGMALAIAWLMERDRRTLRALLVTVPMWAIASIVAIWIAERSMTPSTRTFMQEFWRGGFLPRPFRISTAAAWLWQCLTSLFGDPWTLRLPLPWIFAVLMLAGFVVLWRQRRDVALFVAAPIVLTLLAAMAHQYPFRQRLMVFLIPSALLAASAGAAWIAERARRPAPAVAIVCLALVPAVIAIARAQLPVRVDDYRPLYRHLQANRRPGDAVYISFMATSSAIFYGPQFGLQRNDYRLGACDRNDMRLFLRDLDAFRGRPRVWILTRGTPAMRVTREASGRYLQAIGVRRDAMVVPSDVAAEPVTLELWDLSDPSRLRLASAETFPVPPMPAFPRPSCRDWSGDAAVRR